MRRGQHHSFFDLKAFHEMIVNFNQDCTHFECLPFYIPEVSGLDAEQMLRFISWSSLRRRGLLSWFEPIWMPMSSARPKLYNKQHGVFNVAPKVVITSPSKKNRIFFWFLLKESFRDISLKTTCTKSLHKAFASLLPAFFPQQLFNFHVLPYLPPRPLAVFHSSYTRKLGRGDSGNTEPFGGMRWMVGRLKKGWEWGGGKGATVVQGSLNYSTHFGGDQTIQIYGDFEGIPPQKSLVWGG